MSNTDLQLELSKDRQLFRHLDGLAANEKFAELREQEAIDLVACRMADFMDEMLELRKEIMFNFEDVDASQLIRDELDAWL